MKINDINHCLLHITNLCCVLLKITGYGGGQSGYSHGGHSGYGQVLASYGGGFGHQVASYGGGHHSGYNNGGHYQLISVPIPVSSYGHSGYYGASYYKK